MELHQLRYLRAAVRSGSVTRAAENEHVAQPAVSRQIRLLERELGTPLFHRVGRRVVPTEAGLRMADCADRVLDEIAAAVAALTGPDAESGQRLSFCATETVTEHILPAALTVLRERRPACSMSVEMLGTDDGIARVLADAVDFAIVVLPIADARLVVEPLLAEDVLLAVPKEHRWATEETIALAAALGDPGLLASMRGHGLRSQVDEAAAALGMAISPRVELRSQQALLAMVAAGGGVCFTPRMAVASRSDVSAKPLTPGLRREIGWVRRKGRHVPVVGMELLALVSGRG